MNPHCRPNRANGKNSTFGLELLYGDEVYNPNILEYAVMNANLEKARNRHGRTIEDSFTVFWQDTAMI